MLNTNTLNEEDAPQEVISPDAQAVIKMFDDPSFVKAMFDHPNVQERLSTLATNIAAHVDKTMRNVNY